MTATTVAGKFAVLSKSKDLFQDFVFKQKLPNGAGNGRVIPFRYVSPTIPTTSLDEADDIYQHFYFPSNSRLWQLKVLVATALESGTPASVTDFLIGSTVVINDSQVFRANSSVDELDAGLAGMDVSNALFSQKVVTPGDTEVAGTIEVIGLISLGIPVKLGA